MRLDDVAAFAVSDQAALAGNDRSVQLKLALETNAVLMASPGSDDHLCAIFVQPAHRRSVLFADCFVGPEQRAIQVDGRQSIRELRCGLILILHFRIFCLARTFCRDNLLPGRFVCRFPPGRLGIGRYLCETAVHSLLAKGPSSMILSRRCSSQG